MRSNLLRMHSAWKDWSLSASKDEDGWQSDFPRWSELMSAAMQAMCQSTELDDAEWQALESCWDISEEGEELLEYASEHIEECWPAIEVLATSTLATCRWQVYEAAASAGKNAEPLLRKALEDQDTYARRRAILALARIKPDEGKALAQSLLEDADPYIRKAALYLVQTCTVSD